MKRICLLATLACLLMTACKTTQENWSTRIGNYTYDQAVQEFGTPKTTASGTDGSRVAEWLTRQGSFHTPEFGIAGMYGTSAPAETAIPRSYPDIPSRFLRLTFGPDGRIVRLQVDFKD